MRCVVFRMYLTYRLIGRHLFLSSSCASLYKESAMSGCKYCQDLVQSSFQESAMSALFGFMFASIFNTRYDRTLFGRKKTCCNLCLPSIFAT
uniref:Uncharacterized protein n=1 Tax=Arundo donax TaxID=35708 RepID=A0A0A9EDC9_ARUDO